MFGMRRIVTLKDISKYLGLQNINNMRERTIGIVVCPDSRIGKSNNYKCQETITFSADYLSKNSSEFVRNVIKEKEMNDKDDNLRHLWGGILHLGLQEISL